MPNRKKKNCENTEKSTKCVEYCVQVSLDSQRENGGQRHILENSQHISLQIDELDQAADNNYNDIIIIDANKDQSLLVEPPFNHEKISNRLKDNLQNNFLVLFNSVRKDKGKTEKVNYWMIDNKNAIQDPGLDPINGKRTSVKKLLKFKLGLQSSLQTCTNVNFLFLTRFYG